MVGGGPDAEREGVVPEDCGQADRLLESVEIGNTGVNVVETVLKRQEMVADRRRRLFVSAPRCGALRLMV